VVSTPLKNISQNGNHPQIGVKIKNRALRAILGAPVPLQHLKTAHHKESLQFQGPLHKDERPHETQMALQSQGSVGTTRKEMKDHMM